jgi:hypothetical protein
MSQNYPSSLAALGAVTGADGTAICGAGAASARTAAGIFTLTLDQGCDASQCCIQCMPRGVGTPVVFEVVHTSDTVKTVNVFDSATGAVATDHDFDYVVHKLPLS